MSGNSEVNASEGNSSGQASAEGMMNIIVKTSKERESFQVPTDADVKQLRELVYDRYKIEPSKVCLIFSGKILKDGDLLHNHSKKRRFVLLCPLFNACLLFSARNEGWSHCAFSHSRCK